MKTTREKSRWRGASLYRRRSGAKGSILIIILWILFFLSALTLAIKGYVQPQLEAAGKVKERAAMHYLAKAGVERAILELKNDETDSYDAPSDSWSDNEEAFKEVELGGGRFSVRAPERRSAGEEAGYGLVDEESKININKVSLEALKNLFEIAGEAASEEAGSIAACVIDWRDEDDEPGDDGAEDWHYSNLRFPYRCKNGEFEALEELLLVKGVTPEIFEKIKDKVTIYTGGAVNINTADAPVLRSLGMSEALTEKILDFRSSGGEEESNVFDNVETIAAVLNSEQGLESDEVNALNRIMSFGYLTVLSDNFRGCSTGRPHGSGNSMAIAFVYDRASGVMKYWREE